jgi:hypothetical protein
MMVKNKVFRDFHRYIAVYFLCKNKQHLRANWSQWANIFNQVPFSNLWEPIGHKWDNIFNQVPFSNLWELIGHNSQISLLPNQYHKVPKIAMMNLLPTRCQSSGYGGFLLPLWSRVQISASPKNGISLN